MTESLLEDNSKIVFEDGQTTIGKFLAPKSNVMHSEIKAQIY